jgi:beta-lactamase regulating signal transducer with metallopeptidase domain
VTALPVISLWPRAAAVAVANGQHAAWLTVDPRWSLAIAGIWLLASIWRAGQLTIAAFRVRALWKRATPVETYPTRETAMKGAAERYAAPRSAQICVSDEIDKPTVIGFFAPKILIPGWLLEKVTPAELEQIVLHESGHLGRADDWMNLLQKIALVVFPLNPALAWVERRLCFERELACDEWVLKAVAGRPGASTAYAACLASMAEYRLERRGLVHGLALALGLLGRESELARRVKRILRRGDGMRPVHAKLVLGGAMLGLVVGAAGLERCPRLVGFTPEPGTANARGQRVKNSEEASALGGFRYQAVTLRSKNVAAQQFRSIGDAPARLGAESKIHTKPHVSHEELLKASLSAGNAVEAAAVGNIEVTQRTPSRASTQAPRMVRTLQHGTRQSQDGDVVVAQWVTVTQWRDGDGTRMVMTTARQVMSGADEKTPVMQDSAPQSMAPYAAVPVRGGWLVFQL